MSAGLPPSLLHERRMLTVPSSTTECTLVYSTVLLEQAALAEPTLSWRTLQVCIRLVAAARNENDIEVMNVHTS